MLFVGILFGLPAELGECNSAAAGFFRRIERDVQLNFIPIAVSRLSNHCSTPKLPT